ncbi:MAG TPA: ATP synthase F0 subunit B [Candidatus Sulfotelmatobacter sp.]|jgi:F-type H+-transporting ATPase subunit b
MDQTLQQLGELLLGSVPTVILLTLLYVLYALIVHKPLQRVLTERRSKTEGAVEKSRADIAAAESRTAEYEQKMREARSVIFRDQEAKRQKALQARAGALSHARSKAQAQVQAARLDIEKDRAAAEAGLPAEANALAQEIVRRVLQPAGAGRSGAGR